jgi:hypothetical protein
MAISSLNLDEFVALQYSEFNVAMQHEQDLFCMAVLLWTENHGKKMVEFIL